MKSCIDQVKETTTMDQNKGKKINNIYEPFTYRRTLKIVKINIKFLCNLLNPVPRGRNSFISVTSPEGNRVNTQFREHPLMISDGFKVF